MRRKIKGFTACVRFAAFLVLAPLPAHAYNPGDACSNADVFPQVSLGDGRLMVCDGTIWKSVTDIATDGQSLFQVDNDAGACTATKLGRIKYDGVSTWQYCDGANWSSFGGASTPTAETITAGATITANACGSIKRITSASNVTTNTTNTFTASTAAGCCMDVINTGSNSITLDANTKFKTMGGLDQPLGATETTRVCSDGTDWYQIYTPDIEPAYLAFTDLTDQFGNLQLSSNIVPISGISSTVSVSITGDGSPQYQICSTYNCSSVVQSWTSGTATVSNGQYLQLRMTSNSSTLTANTAVVTVGSGSFAWNITTGDYKIVFVSGTAYNGALGGATGANSKCATLASGAGLSGTFKAWVSGSTTPASSFTQSAVPYKLVDGTTVADDWADLTDGTIDNPINKSQSGSTVSTYAWTNTDTDGTPIYGTSSTNNCQNFTSSSSSYGARVGVSTSSSATWTDYGSSGACNDFYRIYCFQQ